MSQAHSLTPLPAVPEDDGTCRWCLAGAPVTFLGGVPTCGLCVDDLREIASRQGDTMRCPRALVANDVEVAS